MNDAERRLQRALQDAGAPEEHEAEDRAWRVVSATAAHGGGLDARPGRVRRRALQLAAAAGVAVVLASPAGASVRHWIADRLGPGAQHARPVLQSLPGSGSLLVQSREGPWIVRPDGGKRLLGSYTEASWSPHGLYVAATNAHELAAVEPNGTVRWAIARPGPLGLARWNGPDGYRIAYLDGRTLRVIDGDGTNDRPLARSVARVAPAWKAGASHVLAYSTRDGAVEAIAADSRARLFETGPGAIPLSLQWATGRLLVVRPDELRLLSASGRTLWRWGASQHPLLRSASASPHGDAVAAVMQEGNSSRLLLLRPAHPPRVLFAGPGRFARPIWSPDGRWLLLPWPSADQWLFLNPQGSAAKLHAVANVAAQFAPGAPAGAPFPELSGWCCRR